MAILARSPKSPIFWITAKGGPRKIFQKSPKKLPSLQKPNSILAQMAKTGKDFGAKSGSKRAPLAKLWQFLRGHSKPAFSKKKERGDQGKFFNNLPKSRPRLKGPKAHFRKWHYPLNSMHLNGKDWRRFWGKKAAPKVPEWPSYGNFGKVTQKAKSTLAQMSLSFKLYSLIMQRRKKSLGEKAATKRPEWPSYGNFRNVTQDPHFLKKCKGVTKGNFQKSPKK